jgi:hypothetical protein
MAQLIGTIQFTGSLQNLSAYKMRGTDKIIIRKKGGPSKKQIKHSPHFDLTRRNNKEFGGRANAAAHIKRILYPLLFLADYNITGPLNALLQPIQKMDTDSEWGKRHIMISKDARLLEGFTLNRRFLFDSIVRTPVSCTIHQQEQEAIVDLPALLPGINFMVPGNYPWYQFIAVAGLLPDLFYTRDRYLPKDDLGYGAYGPDSIVSTEWLPVNAPAAARKLVLKEWPPKTEACSIMVALGIAFGTMRGQEIEPVKYIGGAKVIRMG